MWERSCEELMQGRAAAGRVRSLHRRHQARLGHSAGWGRGPSAVAGCKEKAAEDGFEILSPGD